MHRADCFHWFSSQLHHHHPGVCEWARSVASQSAIMQPCIVSRRNVCVCKVTKLQTENGFIIWQSRWRCVPRVQGRKMPSRPIEFMAPESHLFCFYFRRRCRLPLTSNLRMTQHTPTLTCTHTFKSVGKDNNDGNHNDSRYGINSTVEERYTVG